MGLKFSSDSKGALGDLASQWSVQEYATPFVPGDSADGQNSCTYTGKRLWNSVFLNDKIGTITHVSEKANLSPLGIVRGLVTSNSLQGGTVGMQQSSIFSQLNVDRVARAITPGNITTDPVTIPKATAMPGYTGGTLKNGALSPDGRYVYVFNSASAAGNGWAAAPYVEKIEVATGLPVWATQITPSPTFSFFYTAMTVTGKTGYIIVQTNLNELMVLRPDTGAIIQTMTNYLTQNFLGNEGTAASNVGTPSFSSDGFNDRFYVANGFFQLSGTVAAPGNTGIGGWGIKRYDLNTVSGQFSPGLTFNSGPMGTGSTGPGAGATTPFTGAYPSVVYALNDKLAVLYGPGSVGDARNQAWSLYNYTLGTPSTTSSRKALLAPSTAIVPGNGLAGLDARGYFLIADHQFDSATGAEVFQWEAQRHLFTDVANISATTLFWRVIGQTQFGNAFYLTSPGDANGRNESARVDIVNSSVYLSDLFEYYFYLVTKTYRVSYKASSNPIVSVQGFVGNVWDHICQLCVAYRVELVLINDVPTVRDLGSTQIDITELGITPSISPSLVGNSRQVSINYYQARTATSAGTGGFNITNIIANPNFLTSLQYWVAGGINPVNSQGMNGSTPNGSIIISAAPGTNDFQNWAKYGNNGDAVGPKIGLLDNVTYRATAEVSVPTVQANPASNARMILVRQYRSDGTYNDTYSQQAPNVAGTYRLSVDFTVDPASPSVEILLLNNNGYQGGNGYTTWRNVRLAQVGASTPDALEGTYFDGSSPGWVWDTVANLSTSHRYVQPTGRDNLMYDAQANDGNVISVSSASTETTTVQSNGWPTTLNQPQPTDDLYDARWGYYYVSAADNLPVKAAQWLAFGGKVTVAINEDDPSQIDVTITGPYTEIPGVAGPYRLAASDGQVDHAFFTVTGTGVRTTPSVLTMPTGVNEINVTRDDGGTTDNFAINTIDQAYDIGFALADQQGAASMGMSFTLPIQRISGFGVTPGATFRYQGIGWRIRQCTINNSTVQVTAERFTRVDEVLGFYTGMTVDQVAAAWAGYTGEDTVLMPFKDPTL